MTKLEELEVALVDPDPEQPRKHFNEASILEMAESLKRCGQKLPVLAFRNAARFTLIDGERRWRSAKAAAIKTLLAVVFENRPPIAELQIAQLTIDVYRTNLSPLEKSNFLVKIQAENKWSVSELAERTSMKQPAVTKLLAFQKLCPELRTLLDSGALDSDKAYVISQEADAARQIALARDAKLLSREQLRRKTHSNGDHFEAKASVARFPLPMGIRVTMQGREITLASAIDSLGLLVKELKRAQSQSLDISTAQCVLADKAKATK